jgi:general secretion pathway protein C
MMVISKSENKIEWLVNKLPAFSSMLLTILIGSSLAILTWQIIAPAPQSIAQHSSRDLTGIPSPTDKPRYEGQIANLHIFGKASKAKADTPPDAPKTRLNLTLHGVFASEDEDAMAIISSGGANERYYHIGDAIPGGATLKAVYPDRVLLERNAKTETLPLPKSENTGIAISRTSAPTVESNPDVGNKLGTLRKEILSNPERLGKLVQARPAMEKGQFKGYQLSPSGDTTLFSELGLEPGDIVTAVNGINIDRPEKGLNALQNLINATEVTVTLLREGSEITLQHELTP